MTARMLLTADTSITDDLSVLLPQPWSVNTTAEYGWGGIPLDCSAFFGTIFWSTEGRLSWDGRFSRQNNPTYHEKAHICNSTVSPAACERGFSTLNIICSPLRNSLSTALISSQLFISLVGPPVHEWKPAKYVSSLIDGQKTTAMHTTILVHAYLSYRLWNISYATNDTCGPLCWLYFNGIMWVSEWLISQW